MKCNTIDQIQQTPADTAYENNGYGPASTPIPNEK